MKPGGRVYLVEYRGEDPEVAAPELHKMTEAQARKELEAVGFEWVENRTFLPTQHFLVFERPGGEG
jgi:predicted methyltransferase